MILSSCEFDDTLQEKDVPKVIIENVNNWLLGFTAIKIIMTISNSALLSAFSIG
jgi:hypothetical protein